MFQIRQVDLRYLNDGDIVSRVFVIKLVSMESPGLILGDAIAGSRNRKIIESPPGIISCYVIEAVAIVRYRGLNDDFPIAGRESAQVTFRCLELEL